MGSATYCFDRYKHVRDRWDGVSPLVTGGAGGQGVTPFIEIPTARSELGETQPSAVEGRNTTAGSSILPSSVMNRTNPATTQR